MLPLVVWVAEVGLVKLPQVNFEAFLPESVAKLRLDLGYFHQENRGLYPGAAKASTISP